MHGVGAQLYACTDFAQLGRLFVYFDVMPGFKQTSRRRETAETGSRNEYFSGTQALSPSVTVVVDSSDLFRLETQIARDCSDIIAL